jgi:hypothetical protein
VLEVEDRKDAASCERDPKFHHMIK